MATLDILSRLGMSGAIPSVPLHLHGRHNDKVTSTFIKFLARGGGLRTFTVYI